MEERERNRYVGTIKRAQYIFYNDFSGLLTSPLSVFLIINQRTRPSDAYFYGSLDMTGAFVFPISHCEIRRRGHRRNEVFCSP